MSNNIRKDLLAGVRRVIIKIGSSVLTGPSGRLEEHVFNTLAAQISALKAQGREIVIVSSGAIAAGMKKLRLDTKPTDIVAKQAIAACGQSTLIWYYERAFSAHSERVAQILLTHDGLTARNRFLNARKTVLSLLSMGIIPIVNENDTVAVEEIMLGDNDNLAALVTSLVEADLLIMLTDIDGLYERDPKSFPDARIIPLVEEVNGELEDLAGDTQGTTTTGGMKTKIQAARTTAMFGVPTIVANGLSPGTLPDIFKGAEVGTLFLPSKSKLKGRKHWIAYTLKPSGALYIDEGAKRAITTSGRSLLPTGVVRVEGRFENGDLVSCVDTEGAEVARGLSSYSSGEIAKIAGLNSQDIEAVLGYKYSDEIIHRDDLVVMQQPGG